MGLHTKVRLGAMSSREEGQKIFIHLNDDELLSATQVSKLDMSCTEEYLYLSATDLC